jgi:histidinol-phosphate/aromatic aminotransferase/cobyric acid decarboxylase-like protein
MASTGNPGVASSLARKNVLELIPYRCARDDYDTGILLDANENAFGPPMEIEGHSSLERYPDPYQFPLKQKICSYRSGFGLRPEHVFVGVVSDCLLLPMGCLVESLVENIRLEVLNSLKCLVVLSCREVMKQSIC